MINQRTEKKRLGMKSLLSVIPSFYPLLNLAFIMDLYHFLSVCT